MEHHFAAVDSEVLKPVTVSLPGVVGPTVSHPRVAAGPTVSHPWVVVGPTVSYPGVAVGPIVSYLGDDVGPTVSHPGVGFVGQTVSHPGVEFDSFDYSLQIVDSVGSAWQPVDSLGFA